jgi:hypothetical protein
LAPQPGLIILLTVAIIMAQVIPMTVHQTILPTVALLVSLKPVRDQAMPTMMG